MFFILFFSISINLELKADDSIFLIKNNEVFLENDGEILKLREKAKNIAFKNAFRVLTEKILEPTDYSKIQQDPEFPVENYVMDYNFKKEKISELNYFSVIDVNFNSSKVNSFFEKMNIKISTFISEDYLIIPIMKRFNTLYLWESENYWYDFLLEEYDDMGLLKLFFPEKNHKNKLMVSPNKILENDFQSLKKFLEFNNKKKAIIIFVEEKFDINKNKFEIKLDAQLFSNNIFTNIKIGDDGLLSEGKNSSEIDLFAKKVINELQNWWKSRIDSEKLANNSESLILISIDSEDIKKSFLIEEAIFEIIGTNNAKIKELRDKKTIYEIFTNYSVKNINLRLESKSLRLIKADSDEKLYKVENY